MKKTLLLLTSLTALNSYHLFAQIIPRNLDAKRTNKAVIIDGKLNDIAWQDAATIDDFTEFRPKAGRKEEKGNHTETFLMYDDAGIYFGGTCYERNMDSVSKPLSLSL